MREEGLKIRDDGSLSGYYDIAVIGAGASGMFAALTAAESRPGRSVILIEANPRVGKKLMMTGNGRCNISNAGAAAENYHGSRSFAAAALKRFSVKDAMGFFAAHGLLITQEDEGKLFPYSLQAGSVCDCLRFSLEEAGVKTFCSTGVRRLSGSRGRFVLDTVPAGRVTAARVIMATGSPAGCGADKELIYGAALGAGHRLTSLLPAIVQVKSASRELRALKGVKINADVSAFSGNRLVGRREGEVLFTEYGLSGPPVLWLSRFVSCGECDRLTIDMMPQFSIGQVLEMLLFRLENFSGRGTDELLSGMLNKRAGQTVLRAACGGKAPDAAVMKRVAGLIKAFPVIPDGVTSMKNAQVCAGGLETSDFDPETMGSRLLPGFYVTGEALNVDGDCGGYNLQWAWTSGHIAGLSAAEGLE